MKWLLGLDLRERCGGTLQLARFLKDKGAAQNIQAVHVVEDIQRVIFSAANPRSEVSDLVTARLQEVLQRENAADIVDDPKLFEGQKPENVLLEIAEGGSVDAVLVGRAAPRDETSMIRLGRVTRRLLRSLPVPTIVTPPDLSYDDIGEGPVMLSTCTGNDSDGAARFAESLAKALGRELLLVHVAPMPVGWGGENLPEETLQYAWSEYGASAQRALERWAGTHGFQEVRSVIGGGWVPGEVGRIAKKEKACIVVCGSRKLGAVSRIFTSSVGSEIAAQLPVPVAIVPNDYKLPKVMPNSSS